MLKTKGVFWKIVLPILGGIVVVGALLMVLISSKHKRPDYDYSAVVSYSEMLGMDAGTSYAYYIYPSKSNDGTYFYIKSVSNITIAGPGDEQDIGYGDLRSAEDVARIREDIEKDSRNNSEQHISCYYNSNGVRKRCESLEELADWLFE